VLILTRADEDPVVNPFGLDELELSTQVCSYKGEYQTSVCAVIFQDAIRKVRSISGAASDHPMYPCYARDRCVPRIRAPDVRAARGFEPVSVVIAKEKVVVAMWVRAQRRVIVKRTKRERSAAPPSAHHLGCR